MSALDRLKLLGDRADPLTRWQAEAELRIEAKTQAQRRTRAPPRTCGGGRERTGAAAAQRDRGPTA